MNVQFRTLLEYAQANEADLATLQEQFACGRGCGLCLPYIRLMLDTGRTSIPVNAVKP